MTPRQSHWMPHIKSPDYAPVKGAVLDPAVLAWIGGSEECWRFRVESLRWIQGRLEDPKSRYWGHYYASFEFFFLISPGCFLSPGASSAVSRVFS